MSGDCVGLACSYLPSPPHSYIRAHPALSRVARNHLPFSGLYFARIVRLLRPLTRAHGKAINSPSSSLSSSCFLSPPFDRNFPFCVSSRTSCPRNRSIRHRRRAIKRSSRLPRLLIIVFQLSSLLVYRAQSIRFISSQLTHPPERSSFGVASISFSARSMKSFFDSDRLMKHMLESLIIARVIIYTRDNQQRASDYRARYFSVKPPTILSVSSSRLAEVNRRGDNETFVRYTRACNEREIEKKKKLDR